LELNHDITEILLKVALNTITPNAGIKPMLMVIINTLARPGSIPGLARGMERKNCYLV
jgi:hypothetical protein